jgi:hypothetical protein
VLEILSIYPSIHPFKLVVSNIGGQFFETKKPTFFSGSSSFYYSKAKKTNAELIETTTLNQFLSKQNNYADIIKIDVEGAELAVLEGGIGLVFEKASFVIIEVGEDNRLLRSSGGTVDDVYSLMGKQGFSCFYDINTHKNTICVADRGSTGDILFSKKQLDLSIFSAWEFRE